MPLAQLTLGLPLFPILGHLFLKALCKTQPANLRPQTMTRMDLITIGNQTTVILLARPITRDGTLVQVRQLEPQAESAQGLMQALALLAALELLLALGLGFKALLVAALELLLALGLGFKALLEVRVISQPACQLVQFTPLAKQALGLLPREGLR